VSAEERVWKVVHAKDGVETVYVVAAVTAREAKTVVLDSLYEREHKLSWTPEEKANDHFGLLQPMGNWSNAYLCRMNGCSLSVTLWLPDEPYKLYALDTRTGAMS
jgi:hypothetical protein